MKKSSLFLIVSAWMLAQSGVALSAEGVNTDRMQQLGKRPYAAKVANKPDQAWEGATLRTEVRPGEDGAVTRKQQFRQQLNLQYSSKRPYMSPDAE